MRYLVDANVLSEATKPGPNPKVLQWLREHEAEFAVSPIILGELEYGILSLPEGKKRRRLEAWLAAGLERLQILDFDAASATTWARLLARLKKSGLAMPIKDSLIAATAIHYRLTLVTRNTKDFQNTELVTLNPFAI